MTLLLYVNSVKCLYQHIYDFPVLCKWSEVYKLLCNFTNSLLSQIQNILYL